MSTKPVESALAETGLRAARRGRRGRWPNTFVWLIALLMSTTLRVDATTAHRVTATLALPWAWFWPDAVPSLELIERTRFFRIAPALNVTRSEIEEALKVLEASFAVL